MRTRTNTIPLGTGAVIALAPDPDAPVAVRRREWARPLPATDLLVDTFEEEITRKFRLRKSKPAESDGIEACK